MTHSIVSATDSAGNEIKVECYSDGSLDFKVVDAAGVQSDWVILDAEETQALLEAVAGTLATARARRG